MFYKLTSCPRLLIFFLTWSIIFIFIFQPFMNHRGCLSLDLCYLIKWRFYEYKGKHQSFLFIFISGSIFQSMFQSIFHILESVSSSSEPFFSSCARMRVIVFISGLEEVVFSVYSVDMGKEAKMIWLMLFPVTDNDCDWLWSLTDICHVHRSVCFCVFSVI